MVSAVCVLGLPSLVGEAPNFFLGLKGSSFGSKANSTSKASDLATLAAGRATRGRTGFRTTGPFCEGLVPAGFSDLESDDGCSSVGSATLSLVMLSFIVVS